MLFIHHYLPVIFVPHNVRFLLNVGHLRQGQQNHKVIVLFLLIRGMSRCMGAPAESTGSFARRWQLVTAGLRLTQGRREGKEQGQKGRNRVDNSFKEPREPLDPAQEISTLRNWTIMSKSQDLHRLVIATQWWPVATQWVASGRPETISRGILS